MRLMFDVKVADRRTGADRSVRVEAPDEATAMARVRGFGGIIGDAVLAEIREREHTPALGENPPTVLAPAQMEYCVDLVTESGLGVLLLGQSSIRIESLDRVLNARGASGWTLAFMVRDNRRFLWLWTRESIFVVFSRERRILPT